MAHKRTATTDLNHDNWNEENEPEEPGTFAKASSDILEKRVLKAARRRLLPRDEPPMKSAFGTFAGFKTTPVTSSSPFSFLANVSTASSTTIVSAATTVNTNKSTTSNGAPKVSENNASKAEDIKTQTLSSTSTSKRALTSQGDEKTRNNSSDYYAKLKGLNESVAQWIKSHVDANPFCILTPIFKDYDKYLKEIISKEESIKTQVSHTLEHTKVVQNNNKSDTSAEKKPDNSPFGNSNAKSVLTGAEWKPEKSIFSNVSPSTKSIFGNTEQKTENPKSLFGSADVTSDVNSPLPCKSIFGNIESNVTSKSIFGNTSVEKNPFLHKSSAVSDDKADEEQVKSDIKSTAPSFPSSTFSFGQSSATTNVSAGFSFGSAKPFSFTAQAVKPQDTEEKTDNENKDEDDEEPPKPDFKPITEEGAIYEQRCKVFVKKDGNFSDRGVGMLFLKPTPNGKTQLIVRAETALGNLLLNTLLTQSIPTKRMNKNTIMLVCLPMPDSSPPPVPVLLRVKTIETAETLLETLNKHKK